MAYHVMLIDDSEPDTLYTSIVLQRCGQPFEVTTFESARDALAHLERGGLPPDIILLDINMPGMDGFEFLEHYQKLGPMQRAGAVVVMLTSSPDPADRERAMNYPVVRAYLTKPVDAASAAALVQYVARA